MTWAALLLADPSPCLRMLVLRELLGRTDDDPEVRELVELREQDPLAVDLLAWQQQDGSWERVDHVSQLSTIRSTGLALYRLGYLGFGPVIPTVPVGQAHPGLQLLPDDAGRVALLNLEAEGDEVAHEAVGLAA